MRECFNPLTVWGSIVSSWLQIEGRQQFEVPWHVHELCVSSPNYGSLRTHAISTHQRFLSIFFLFLLRHFPCTLVEGVNVCNGSLSKQNHFSLEKSPPPWNHIA